jgi:hypothetical protein
MTIVLNWIYRQAENDIVRMCGSSLADLNNPQNTIFILQTYAEKLANNGEYEKVRLDF